MRELKFRFWDTSENIFINFCCVDANGRVKEGKHFYNDVIPQQYTGLKDKNGKEIYEGDILQIVYSSDPEDPEWGVGEVLWIDGCMVFRDHETTRLNEFLSGGKIDGIIIGNIFENPELLK